MLTVRPTKPDHNLPVDDLNAVLQEGRLDPLGMSQVVKRPGLSSGVREFRLGLLSVLSIRQIDYHMD